MVVFLSYMTKRNTKQRRNLIASALEASGELYVDALAKEYATSEVTIRKDLAALEEAGLLLRRYGGAVAMPKELLSDEASSQELSARKQAIAKSAASLIRDHNRIIIDSGTTTRALIPHLNTFRGLVVMTNSIQVANQLRELENEPTILMTGGTWDKRSESFQGVMAEKMLREYNFDQVFIGADGIDTDRGTTTYNEFFALSRTMAEVSREVIVMAESSKTLRKIPNLELAWEQISTFISDSELSVACKNHIQSKRVRVIRSKLQHGD